MSDSCEDRDAASTFSVVVAEAVELAGEVLAVALPKAGAHP